MSRFPELVTVLEKIDRMRLGPRDVMILWAVTERPGSNGTDIQHILGLQSRSWVSNQLLRLIRRELIEDRRGPEQEFQGVPSIYHPTEKGLKFCTELFGL